MLGNKCLERINSAVLSAVKNGEYAGVVCAAMKNGSLIYKNAWGMADIERDIPMSEDSIFRLHSLSKVVTSAAVMKLIETGRLEFESKASDYIGGFKNQQVITADGLAPAQREVTVRDLLNMTSGCVYPGEDDEAAREMGKVFYDAEQAYLKGKPYTTYEMADRIGRSPLLFQPGERWHYGTSADVLGAIVEKAADKPYDEFLRDEFFSPLGMNDTGFYVPAEKTNRFAQLYDFSQGKPEIFRNSFLGLYNYNSRPAFISGGGGMVSTVLDFIKFSAMLSNNGEYDGIRILKPETVDIMARDNLTDAQKVEYKDWWSCRGYGYGNLCRVLTDRESCASKAPLGEFGWDGWAGCYSLCNREDNFAFALFVQRCGTGTAQLAIDVKNIMLEEIHSE